MFQVMYKPNSLILDSFTVLDCTLYCGVYPPSDAFKLEDSSVVRCDAVTGRAIPDVSKDHRTFVFRVKQFSYPFKTQVLRSFDVPET